MVTALSVMFLIVHGVLHIVVWMPPQPKADSPAPFDPSHSTLLATVGVRARATRALAVTLAAGAAAAYLLAAVALAADATWWGVLAMVGAALGLVLKLGYFNAWLSLGIALDAGVVVAVLANWPAGLP